MLTCHYCGRDNFKSQGGLTNHQHSCSTKQDIKRREQQANENARFGQIESTLAGLVQQGQTTESTLVALVQAGQNVASYLSQLDQNVAQLDQNVAQFGKEVIRMSNTLEKVLAFKTKQDAIFDNVQNALEQGSNDILTLEGSQMLEYLIKENDKIFKEEEIQIMTENTDLCEHLRERGLLIKNIIADKKIKFWF